MLWKASLAAWLLSAIVAAGVVRAAEAEAFADRFAAAAEQGDEAKLESLLKAWKAAEPANPEPYVAAANYYAQQAEARIEISTAPPQPGGLALEQEGQSAGSLGTSAVDRKQAAKAIAELQAALGKFPDRLDIWFGLAYLHQNFGVFEDLLATLKGALAHAGKNPQRLLWAGESVKDPAATIAEAAQGYMAAYLESGTPGDDRRALLLAEAVSAAYPRHPFPINVIGYYYAGREEWPKAIEYFEKARELVPGDPVVLINLGIAYAKLGDKAKARTCFEKILAGDADPDLRADAAQRLADLK